MSEGAPRLHIAGLRLHPPARPRDLVVRHRLLDRLDEATRARCTLISAGPGYGKSVLLSSWVTLQNQFSRVAWLTLEAGDANPQRLVEHLVAALQEAFRSAPDAAPELMQLRPPPPVYGREPLQEAFLAEALLPALDSMDQPLVLVVDDAHHLGSSPAAVAGLNLLLRWAPETLRLVLAGRYDPPLALQRLRIGGQLTTLRQHELACTPVETRAVLAASGLRLAPEDSSDLHDLTQGWPAALRLAALALRERGTAPEFLERFLARDVALADYLTSEVLEWLSPSLRAFLLRATIDPVVCGSLVDAVRGGGDGDALLGECESRNLFLTCVSPDREWYAWHHMFADQMQRRFATEDPAAAREAHLAAARWWRVTDAGRAAHHAVAGGDESLAAEIVAQAWVGLALAGESGTLLELVAALPEQPAYTAELRLAACYAHLLQADQERATTALEEALVARASIPSPLRQRFDARAAWLKLLLADQHEGLAEVLTRARAVLEATPATVVDQDDPTYALAVLAVGMAEARLQRDPQSAIASLRTAAEAGRRQQLEVLELMARAELCLPLITEGDLLGVEHEAEALVEEAEWRGWQSFGPIAHPLAYLGWLAYWRGDLVTARRHLARARRICPALDWHRGWIVYFHGRTCLASGDVNGAEEDLRTLTAYTGAGTMPPGADSLVAGLEAGIIAAGGDVERALVALARPAGPEHRLTAGVRADLLRRAGRAEEALSVLDQTESPQSHTEVLHQVLRSLALRDLGDQEDAHLALERALAAAERASLMGPFVEQGDDLGPLVDAHIQRGTSHEAFATEVASKLTGDIQQVANGRHERLTDRELSILRYLRTSMPNAEIASQLFVSVNTVKTHAAAIYRKLGVSGRRQAVHRAEELGLFGFAAPEVPRARVGHDDPEVLRSGAQH